MQQQKIFLYSPGGENDGGNTLSNNIEDNVTGNDEAAKVESAHKVEADEKRSFIEKVQDALQQWSNDDQSDQEFDDTRP